MRRSIRKFNIPPWATPRAFQLLKIDLFKFPPLGAKKPFKCSPISTELPLLKDNLVFNQPLFALFRERCCNDTFKLLLKTLLKALFTNKGELKFCLVNPSNPEKTEKTHGRITSEQEINPVQIPHPSNATLRFPPPRARCTVKCLGYYRGEC